MTKLCIHSKDLSSDFADLKALADLVPTKSDPSSTTPPSAKIEDSDLRLFAANTGKPFAVKLYSEQGEEVPIQDQENLEHIFSELQKLRTNQNENEEARFPKKDIWVELSDSTTSDVSLNLSQISAEFKPSVVGVYFIYDAPMAGSPGGTASVSESLKNPDGSYTIRLLTNFHMVRKYNEGVIGYKIYDANDNFVSADVKVVGSDPMTDIGILEFTSDKPWKPIPIDNPVTSEFYPGEQLVEIGNTKARGINAQIVHVNSINTSYENYPVTYNDNFPFPTVSIRGDVRGGNSGSPLLTSQRQFAGVHFGGTPISYDDEGKNKYWVGGFLPVDRVLKSYQNILDHRDTKGVVYSDWGINAFSMEENDSFWETHPQLGKKGIVATKVFNHGAAAEAGIKSGDILISATLDNQTTTFDIHADNHMHEFLTYMLDSNSEKKYSLEIYRPSEDKMLTLTLTPKQRSFIPNEYMTTQQGFAVYDIPDTLKWREQDFFETHPGITIDFPDDKNPYNNMLVTAINDIPTPDVASFRTEYDRCQKSGKPYTLTITSTPMTNKTTEGGSGAVYYEQYRFY